MFGGDINKIEAALTDQMNRVASLEKQGAADTKAITDGMLAQVMPEVKAARESINQAVVVFSNSVTEALALMRRVGASKLQFSLGPEETEFPEDQKGAAK